MFLLYNGNEGGTQEARLVERVHPVQWELVRRNAVRSLRFLSYDLDSADALDKLPFELWKGTNGFGDQFELLYMKIPIATYLEIELDADTYRSKSRYERIAREMEEVQNPIRFIGWTQTSKVRRSCPHRNCRSRLPLLSAH
jgi:hypothetical protein